jgi:hypothetical protein
MKDDWNQSTMIKTEMEFTGYSNDIHTNYELNLFIKATQRNLEM